MRAFQQRYAVQAWYRWSHRTRGERNLLSRGLKLSRVASLSRLIVRWRMVVLQRRSARALRTIIMHRLVHTYWKMWRAHCQRRSAARVEQPAIRIWLQHTIVPALALRAFLSWPWLTVADEAVSTDACRRVRRAFAIGHAVPRWPVIVAACASCDVAGQVPQVPKSPLLMLADPCRELYVNAFEDLYSNHPPAWYLQSESRKRLQQAWHEWCGQWRRQRLYRQWPARQHAIRAPWAGWRLVFRAFVFLRGRLHARSIRAALQLWRLRTAAHLAVEDPVLWLPSNGFSQTIVSACAAFSDQDATVTRWLMRRALFALASCWRAWRERRRLGACEDQCVALRARYLLRFVFRHWRTLCRASSHDRNIWRSCMSRVIATVRVVSRDQLQADLFCRINRQLRCFAHWRTLAVERQEIMCTLEQELRAVDSLLSQSVAAPRPLIPAIPVSATLAPTPLAASSGPERIMSTNHGSVQSTRPVVASRLKVGIVRPRHPSSGRATIASSGGSYAAMHQRKVSQLTAAADSSIASTNTSVNQDLIYVDHRADVHLAVAIEPSTAAGVAATAMDEAVLGRYRRAPSPIEDAAESALVVPGSPMASVRAGPAKHVRFHSPVAWCLRAESAHVLVENWQPNMQH
jgi:hypothetical protein